MTAAKGRRQLLGAKVQPEAQRMIPAESGPMAYTMLYMFFNGLNIHDVFFLNLF